jgi:hypothetical protein
MRVNFIDRPYASYTLHQLYSDEIRIGRGKSGNLFVFRRL